MMEPASTTDSRLRKIVSVNTADQGGGAERIAWDLVQGYRRRHLDSWLVVGDKKTTDPNVLPFFLSPYLDYRPYALRWPTWKRGCLKWLSRAAGVEDFEFPYAHHLEAITGSCPDLIHCHNLHGGYFDLRALPSLSHRVPVVVTLHDSWLLNACHPRDVGAKADGRRRSLLRSCSLWCDRRRLAKIFGRCRFFVAAPTRWLLEQIPGSLLAPAVVESRLITHGVDLKRFHPRPKQEARAALPLPKEGHLVVFAAWQARSNPIKDYAAIAGMARRLGQMQLSCPLHVLVIGEASPREQFGKVTLEHIPFLDQASLVSYFQAADVYVHAAKLETFGLVLIAAMACGTPVVATAVGGIPEVVDNGSDGFLTSPRDPAALAAHVHRLLRNPELRYAMSARAVQRAQRHWNRERMIDAYLDWFREIIAEHRTFTVPSHATPQEGRAA